MSKKKIKTYRGAVMTWECDSNGHMNVMYYVNKYELGGRNFGYELGLTNEFLKEHNLGIAVVKQELNYIQEAFEDDLLYIESSLQKIGTTSFTSFHELKKVEDDQLMGTARVTLVIFDKTLRKSVPLNSSVKAKMAALL